MLETFAAQECDTCDLQLQELEREFARINLRGSCMLTMQVYQTDANGCNQIVVCVIASNRSYFFRDYPEPIGSNCRGHTSVPSVCSDDPASQQGSRPSF